MHSIPYAKDSVCTGGCWTSEQGRTFLFFALLSVVYSRHSSVVTKGVNLPRE